MKSTPISAQDEGDSFTGLFLLLYKSIEVDELFQFGRSFVNRESAKFQFDVPGTHCMILKKTLRSLVQLPNIITKRKHSLSKQLISLHKPIFDRPEQSSVETNAVQISTIDMNHVSYMSLVK